LYTQKKIPKFVLIVGYKKVSHIFVGKTHYYSA
jgi:hypothetical protein